MALKHAPNRPAVGALPAPAGDQQPLILVVEDDPVLHEVIRSNLGERGYRIASAATAVDAVALARAQTPDALLLDVNLPDGSGWEVLHALRAQHQELPTVVMSALRCSRARLDEFRPAAYLPKPFPLSALLAAIERLVGDPRASGGRLAMPRVQASVAPAPAQVSPDLSRPTAGELAACDLVADPTSGITRVTVAGTTPSAVERMKALAARRGLVATGEYSPALRRGWVRISRAAAEPAPAEQELRKEEAHGRRAVPGTDRWLSRAAAWLRRGLREAVGAPAA